MTILKLLKSLKSQIFQWTTSKFIEVPISFLGKYNPKQFEIVAINPHFFSLVEQEIPKPTQLKIIRIDDLFLLKTDKKRLEWFRVINIVSTLLVSS